jgi:hypothetical protein
MGKKEIFQFGEFRLDPALRTLRRRQEVLALKRLGDLALPKIQHEPQNGYCTEERYGSRIEGDRASHPSATRLRKDGAPRG